MVGRPKKQVNEVSKVRFGMILDELKTDRGISQTEFGKRIHTAQQTVSKLRTGEIEVSSTHAQAVARAFPQYRAEWLLGLDDYKSPFDAAQARAAEWRARNDNRRMVFDGLLDMTCWTQVEFPSNVIHSGLDIAAPYTGNGEPFDMTAINAEKDANFIRLGNGKKCVTLSRFDYDALIQKMSDYLAFELDHAQAESSGIERG